MKKTKNYLNWFILVWTGLANINIVHRTNQRKRFQWLSSLDCRMWHSFCLIFLQSSVLQLLAFFSSTVNDIRGKLYMVGTYSNVEKNEQKECQILQSRLLTLTTEKNKKLFKLVHIGLNRFSEEKKMFAVPISDRGWNNSHHWKKQKIL